MFVCYIQKSYIQDQNRKKQILSNKISYRSIDYLQAYWLKKWFRNKNIYQSITKKQIIIIVSFCKNNKDLYDRSLLNYLNFINSILLYLKIN